MPKYVEPSAVTSPQTSISNLRAVCDRGEWDYSVAVFDWDHEPCVGIRWNGGTGDDDKSPRPGNPQSRGLPTWFAVPKEFDVPVLEALLNQDLIGGGSIDKKEAEAHVRHELAARKGDAPTKPKKNDLEAAVLAAIKKLKAAGEI